MIFVPDAVQLCRMEAVRAAVIKRRPFGNRQENSIRAEDPKDPQEESSFWESFWEERPC